MFVFRAKAPKGKEGEVKTTTISVRIVGVSPLIFPEPGAWPKFKVGAPGIPPSVIKHAMVAAVDQKFKQRKVK